MHDRALKDITEGCTEAPQVKAGVIGEVGSCWPIHGETCFCSMCTWFLHERISVLPHHTRLFYRVKMVFTFVATRKFYMSCNTNIFIGNKIGIFVYNLTYTVKKCLKCLTRSCEHHFPCFVQVLISTALLRKSRHLRSSHRAHHRVFGRF